MTTRNLDPVTLARLKRALRCPDCDSTVRIDQTARPPRGNVLHAESCPALAALERQGRTWQLGVVQMPGGTHQQMVEAVAGVAQWLAEKAGQPVRIASHPYAGLGLGGPA